MIKMRVAGTVVGTALLAVLLAACDGMGGGPGGDAQASGAGPKVDQAFVAEQQAWRNQRVEDLLRPDPEPAPEERTERRA